MYKINLKLLFQHEEMSIVSNALEKYVKSKIIKLQNRIEYYSACVIGYENSLINQQKDKGHSFFSFRGIVGDIFRIPFVLEG